MELLGTDIPQWVLDWSGSVLVAVSLLALFEKRTSYWYWSNASLVPYFALFLSTDQLMLAGLQLSYLIFGLHGLRLWQLERRRDTLGRPFDERFWYPLGWIGSLAIFAYTVLATEFVDRWAWLQFTIVSLALLANWATTRKWTWSWPVWLAVNTLQAVYFHHYEWGTVRAPVRALLDVGLRMAAVAHRRPPAGVGSCLRLVTRWSSGSSHHCTTATSY